MRLEDLETSFRDAGPLALSDILHNAGERVFFRKCMIHCILRITVGHGKLDHFTEQLRESTPRTEQAIELHKTDLHPLPTWKIDESTIVGNADVDEAIVNELRLRNQPTHWMKYVRLLAGDQLSIARLRSLANIRAGHEDTYSSFGWGVWSLGLFHTKIADMHGFFVTHWGKPNCGSRNPGSLSFHNILLRQLPISLTSLPTFRTCRDLVFVSLYGRVLECMLSVSGHQTMDDYRLLVTSWDSIYAHATAVVDQFTNARRVHELRTERERGDSNSASGGGGDMVLENAILFLRDALITREYTDAIKAGDSGRVLLVLKIWALSFRGNGRTKYAYEMLCIIHNLTHVWPKPISYVFSSRIESVLLILVTGLSCSIIGC